MSDEQQVLVKLADNILTIAFNRPDKKNALTQEMYAIAADALANAEEDKACRVVLFRGTQDCFTSGNDINDFLGNATEGDSPVVRFIQMIARFKKPMMAAVNGPAIGVGTTMLLHCDMVVAADTAVLQLPFAALGVCPEAGSSYLLPQLMGPQRAARLLMLGEKFGADEALTYGLVNEVASADDYLQVAERLAAQLAAMPPSSVQKTKELLRKPHQEALKAAMDSEFEQFATLLSSPEAVEAMTAFIERRAPDFSQF